MRIIVTLLSIIALCCMPSPILPITCAVEEPCDFDTAPVTFDQKVCYNELLYDTCGVGCGPEMYYGASTEKQSSNKEYSPEKAGDFKVNTAWIELYDKKKGHSYLTLKMAEEQRSFGGIWIFNGYQTSEKLWKDYARVKTFNVYFNGKFNKKVELKDDPEIQEFAMDIDIDIIKKGDIFKLEIVETYPGKMDGSVAISEIGLVGTH